jgi:hypothetical protein
MMTMTIADDEEFANCWKRDRCEYIPEEVVFVFPM